MWYFQDGEPVLHVTEIGDFLTCPHRWAQRRKGEFLPAVSTPMVRGKAAHKARRRAIEHWMGVEFDEDNNPYIIEDPPRRFPTFEELCEIGRDEIAKHCSDEGILFTDDGEQVDGAGVLEDAARYIEFDVKAVLPTFIEHVEKAEHRLTSPLRIVSARHDWHLTGQVDCLAREPVSRRLCNRDMKTGSFSQREADMSDQPAGYSMLIDAHYDERPIHVFDTMRFLKNPPRKMAPGATVQQLEDGIWAVSETFQADRHREDMARFGKKIAIVVDMIEQEFFPPAGTGFMSPCYRCPYFRECEYAGTGGGHA